MRFRSNILTLRGWIHIYVVMGCLITPEMAVVSEAYWLPETWLIRGCTPAAR